MKSALLMLVLVLSSVTVWAQAITITKSSGWLESAFAEWQPVMGAQSYNVYYSGAGVTNKKLDDPLIRKYGAFYRADAVGLKAGSYTLRIVPVVNGSEGTGSTTSTLTVVAHDRTGFAFANNRVPGAYNLDGTAKNGAVILYVTEATKNTISLDVTGANANPCVGLQAILDGFAKGKDFRPLIIRLVGQITDPANLQNGDAVIENGKNSSSSITLEGVGQDAVVDGWGIRIKNATNIEIRNVGIMNVNSTETDNIGLQQNNDYIWVHNVDFFYGHAGSAADQAKGDGALDCKKSTYITFSYNHFWDSGKSNLLGLSENTTAGLYITYHHNWYDHSDSRHPRVRFYSAHVYNNYYDGVSKYGVGSTLGSSVFVEGNYFRNCKYPMLTSMQGSDVWSESKGANDYANMGTFSDEDGGTIKAYNNYMTGQKRFVAYGATGYSNATVDFDAYVVTSRTATVPSTVKSAYGANTYNNFDTDAAQMYTYVSDSPEDAKTKVMTYAGRVSGGDFKWSFDNSVDDTASAVNTELKAALVGYKTALVSIQGVGGVVVIPPSSSVVSSSSSIATSSSSNAVIPGNVVHNFTLSGTSSTFFNITGALSTSKGTVSYSGLTLTQCLKMESATEIAFSLDKPAMLTLVFNADFSGNVLLDGVNHSVSGGILSVSLSPGSHAIKKGDVANLFYMSLVFSGQTTFTIQAKHSAPNPLHYDVIAKRVYVSEGYKIQDVRVYNSRGSVISNIQFVGNEILLPGEDSGFHMVVVRTDHGKFIKSIFVP